MISHSKPYIDEADIASVSQALSENRLAGGYYVEKFENRIANYFETSGGVATNSGTTALHLALIGLNIRPGDQIAIPSYVCASLLQAVKYVGAFPLLIDTDFETMNMDIHDLHRKVSPLTKAIIVPHLFGCPVEMESLKDLEIPVIEDCAQSLGATYNDRPVGSFGLLSVCSFYATKVIASGEGGMVCAASAQLDEKIRDLQDPDEKDDFILRFNYKMSDIHAALGLSQFQKLDEFIRIRQSLAGIYSEAFHNLPVMLPKNLKKSGHIYYRYVIKVPNHADTIIRKMNDEGIGCRRPIYKPLHHYLNHGECPVTDTVFEQAISIPIYPGLTQQQQEFIITKFTKILRETA